MGNTGETRDDKQQRYQELKARFDVSIDSGQPAISDEESQERIALHYELNGIEPPTLDVPISITSSDPRDGGMTIWPKRPKG